MLSIDDINKLKEENAVLQAYKDVNEDFKKAWEELKAENEQLKELKCKFKEYCTCNTEKYVKCLQEIKEIANHWQNRWWNDIDERQGFDEILDLITKAESEEV